MEAVLWMGHRDQPILWNKYDNVRRLAMDV